MRLGDWGSLFVLSALWGSSFFFVKVAVAEIAPLTMVFVRTLLASLLLYIVLRIQGHSLRLPPALWRDLSIMGLLNNIVPFSLFFWGQQHIPAGLGSILNATTPLFAVVLAHYALRDERMSTGRILGVLAGIIGVAVLIGPDALSGLGTHVLAQLAVIGAAFSYAVAGVYGRRLRDLPPLVPATGQVIASTVIMLPVVLLFSRPWQAPLPSTAAIASLVALAVLGTMLAYMIYFRLLASVGATNVLLVTFLMPVSAILLGTFILGERLAPRHFAGMLLIALGLALIDGRVARRLINKGRREL